MLVSSFCGHCTIIHVAVLRENQGYSIYEMDFFRAHFTDARNAVASATTRSVSAVRHQLCMKL